MHQVLERWAETIGVRSGGRLVLAAGAAGAVLGAAFVLGQRGVASVASDPAPPAARVAVRDVIHPVATDPATTTLAPRVAGAGSAPTAPATAGALDDGAIEVRWFDGRPIVPVSTMRMRVTAYSPDERSCAPFADGRTASGYSVWTNAGKLVAADSRVLPLGSLVSVPGYDDGAVVPVLDRGGRIKGRRLDVLFPTHGAARQWGVRELDVVVWGYADGAANGFRKRW